MGDELAAYVQKRMQTHVDHHRLPGPHQAFPVQIAEAAVSEMPGDKQHSLRMVPVCQRNAGIAGDTARGCDAWYDFKVHAMLRQFLHLLAAASEHERIPALQAHNLLALAGLLHQQRVDVLLAHRMFAAPLAGINELCV